jgi:hypothetical protein
MLSRGRGCDHVENPALDGQSGVGRDDKDAIRFDGDAVGGGHDWNGTLRPK